MRNLSNIPPKVFAALEKVQRNHGNLDKSDETRLIGRKYTILMVSNTYKASESQETNLPPTIISFIAVLER